MQALQFDVRKKQIAPNREEGKISSEGAIERFNISQTKLDFSLK